MKTDKKMLIFLVDDDMVFLKALEIDFMNTPEYEVRAFRTGELCVESLSEKPDIIVLDYNLDGIEKKAMNGIETLDVIKEYDANTAVIMLSGQDKIEVAIECMHHKAFDYVVKSETAFMRVEKIITTIQNIKRMEAELSWYMDRA
jgi:two-component system, OmpR family, response regulator